MSAGSRKAGNQTVYQIKVQGRLDASWSDWLSGMTLTVGKRDDGSTVTVLTGTVVD